MPISSELRRAGPFTGDDVAVEFNFAFKVLDALHVRVEKLEVATDIIEVLDIVTDYDVVLNSDQDDDPGGTVTLVDPLETGFKLTITSKTPIKQPQDFQNPVGFYPRNLNTGLDRAVILIQEIYDKISRSFFVPISDNELGENSFLPSASQRADKVLSFDSSGNPEAVITKDEIRNAQANAEAALEQATLAIAAANTATAAANAAVIAASGVNEIGSLKLFPSNTPQTAPFAHWLPLYDIEYEVLKSAYPLLYAVAVTHSWAKDGPSGSAYFAIPTLNGYFIRIIDKTATNDPDAASRSAFTGGSGNLPFSKQEDAFQNHVHGYDRAFAGGEADNASGGNPYGGNSGANTGGATGRVSSETRGKNAAFAAYIVAKLPGT